MSRVDTLADTRSLDDVKTVCRSVAVGHGFEYFLFGAYLPAGNDITVINGFPSAWRERYDELDYLHDDPVVRHASENSTAIDWRSLSLGTRSRQARGALIMHEAAEHGLAYGLSLPTHGAGAEWGLLSVASASDRPVGGSGRDSGLQFFAQSVHEAVKRIVQHGDSSADCAKPLTERESECLTWVANGKTAWETARILGLSESTITFHVQNAIQKLGVANRPQAVARALALSRIAIF